MSVYTYLLCCLQTAVVIATTCVEGYATVCSEAPAAAAGGLLLQVRSKSVAAAEPWANVVEGLVQNGIARAVENEEARIGQSASGILETVSDENSKLRAELGDEETTAENMAQDGIKHAAQLVIGELEHGEAVVDKVFTNVDHDLKKAVKGVQAVRREEHDFEVQADEFLNRSAVIAGSGVGEGLKSVTHPVERATAEAAAEAEAVLEVVENEMAKVHKAVSEDGQALNAEVEAEASGAQTVLHQDRVAMDETVAAGVRAASGVVERMEKSVGTITGLSPSLLQLQEDEPISQKILNATAKVKTNVAAFDDQVEQVRDQLHAEENRISNEVREVEDGVAKEVRGKVDAVAELVLDGEAEVSREVQSETEHAVDGISGYVQQVKSVGEQVQEVLTTVKDSYDELVTEGTQKADEISKVLNLVETDAKTRSEDIPALTSIAEGIKQVSDQVQSVAAGANQKIEEQVTMVNKVVHDATASAHDIEHKVSEVSAAVGDVAQQAEQEVDMLKDSADQAVKVEHMVAEQIFQGTGAHLLQTDRAHDKDGLVSGIPILSDALKMAGDGVNEFAGVVKSAEKSVNSTVSQVTSAIDDGVDKVSGLVKGAEQNVKGAVFKAETAADGAVSQAETGVSNAKEVDGRLDSVVEKVARTATEMQDGVNKAMRLTAVGRTAGRAPVVGRVVETAAQLVDQVATAVNATEQIINEQVMAATDAVDQVTAKRKQDVTQVADAVRDVEAQAEGAVDTAEAQVAGVIDEAEKGARRVQKVDENLDSGTEKVMDAVSGVSQALRLTVTDRTRLDFPGLHDAATMFKQAVDTVASNVATAETAIDTQMATTKAAIDGAVGTAESNMDWVADSAEGKEDEISAPVGQAEAAVDAVVSQARDAIQTMKQVDQKLDDMGSQAAAVVSAVR